LNDNPNQFAPGDIVDITIKGVRVAHESPVGLLTIVDEHGGLFPMPPQAAIERGTPDVQPGDLWRDCNGDLWFGRLDQDFDSSRPNEIQLIPAKGDMDYLPVRPAGVAHDCGPLTLVHREDGTR
jgi:hypothetical protein